MNYSINPGKPGTPAVAAVPEVEPTIEITLTKEEAAMLAALTGQLAGKASTNLYGLYSALYDFSDLHTFRLSTSKDDPFGASPCLYLTKTS